MLLTMLSALVNSRKISREHRIRAEHSEFAVCEEDTPFRSEKAIWGMPRRGLRWQALNARVNRTYLVDADGAVSIFKPGGLEVPTCGLIAVRFFAKWFRVTMMVQRCQKPK